MITTLRAVLLAVVGAVSLAASAVAQTPLEQGIAAYERGDFAAAFRLWRPLAERGDAYAQTNLGKLYRNGKGVPLNPPEAIKWFRLAAEQGDAMAQSNLGRMHDAGEGVPENDAAAVKWYRMAADQGYAIAQGYLGAMYGAGQGVPKNYVEAYKWFALAADQELSLEMDPLSFLRGKMTPAQIAEGQKLAAEWKPK